MNIVILIYIVTVTNLLDPIKVIYVELQSKQGHIQSEGEISVTNMRTPPAKSATRSLSVAGTLPLTSFRVMLELRVAVEPSRPHTRVCERAS